MLTAIAFVPSAPLLLDALGGGPADLRNACQQAISVLPAVDRVVVVGAAQVSGLVEGEVDASGFGAPGGGSSSGPALPLAHAVGVTLLGGRPGACWGVGPEGNAPFLPPSTTFGLLVVGDGSARCGEKAPGHLDRRAAGVNDAIAAALADGDHQALSALDPMLCSDLLVGGRQAWGSAAAAAAAELSPRGSAPQGWQGDLLYAEAPYGVFYAVATWVPRR